MESEVAVLLVRYNGISGIMRSRTAMATAMGELGKGGTLAERARFVALGGGSGGWGDVRADRSRRF